MIKIKFDSQIKIDSQISDHLQYELNNKSIEISSIKVTNQNEQEIDLNLEKNYENSEFKISLKKDDINTNNMNTPLIFNPNNNKQYIKFPIKVPFSIYIDPNEGVFTSLSQAGLVSIFVISGPLLLTNPVRMISLIRLIQSFGFLSYINIDLPVIVKKIFIELEINLGRIFPVLFFNISIDDSPY